MKINAPNTTNFKAKFICNTQIKQINPKTDTYSPLKVSFLEYEPDNPKDLNALINTAKSWKGRLYAGRIAENASLISSGDMSKNKNHIYILSKQQENFNKLNTQDILGLAHLVSESKSMPDELRLFEVNPKFKYSRDKKREYKGLGESIISSLKKICNNSIRLISSYSAANFYEKQGFEIMDTDLLEYIWKK